MFEYIHVLFSLLSGIIFTVIMYIRDTPLEKWLVNVIVIMIVMLIVGYFVRFYFRTKVFNKNDQIENTENEDVDPEGEDGEDSLSIQQGTEKRGNNINFDNDDDD